MASVRPFTPTSAPNLPVTPAEFEERKRTALFGDEDVTFLRMSRDVLADQTDAVLDVWYGFVGSQPHLVSSFAVPAGGAPDPGYLAAVRVRFGQWILETAAAEYDERWLASQLEIGRRHHRVGKGRTDGVSSTALVPFRHLFPLGFPLVATLKPFLAKKGHAAGDVDRMHAAWLKSVLLQVTLRGLLGGYSSSFGGIGAMNSCMMTSAIAISDSTYHMSNERSPDAFL